MEVWKLDPIHFGKIDLVEEYESCIWNERFIEPGDFRLTIPATHENAVFCRPGSLLLYDTSDEPMLIETREIKGKMITATGKTLEAIFDQRSTDSTAYYNSPGRIMGSIVTNIQNRWEGRYGIPGLRNGSLAGGDSVLHIFNEPKKGHAALLEVANKYQVGMRVVWVQNDPADVANGAPPHELVFNTRVGVDRSFKPNMTDADDYVRFAPQDDNFANVNEVYSVADQVDYVVVIPPRHILEGSIGQPGRDLVPVLHPKPGPFGDHTSLVGMPDYKPFQTRVHEVASEEMTSKWLASFGGSSWTQGGENSKAIVVEDAMREKARKIWTTLNLTPKIAIEGEVVPNTVIFGRDYHLGDTVQVEGEFTGGERKAVVTEFIRSSDGSGNRAYPTLAEPTRVAPEYDEQAT